MVHKHMHHPVGSERSRGDCSISMTGVDVATTEQTDEFICRSLCMSIQCSMVTVGVRQCVQCCGVACTVTGLCTVQVQRLQAVSTLPLALNKLFRVSRKCKLVQLVRFLQHCDTVIRWPLHCVRA